MAWFGRPPFPVSGSPAGTSPKADEEVGTVYRVSIKQRFLDWNSWEIETLGVDMRFFSVFQY